MNQYGIEWGGIGNALQAATPPPSPRHPVLHCVGLMRSRFTGGKGTHCPKYYPDLGITQWVHVLQIHRWYGTLSQIYPDFGITLWVHELQIHRWYWYTVPKMIQISP